MKLFNISFFIIKEEKNKMMNLETRIMQKIVSPGSYDPKLASDLIFLSDIKNIRIEDVEEYITFFEGYKIKNKLSVNRFRRKLIEEVAEFLSLTSKELSFFQITKILIYLSYMSKEKEQWRNVRRNRKVSFCMGYIKMINNIPLNKRDISTCLNNLKN